MLPNGYKDFIKDKINEFYIKNNRLPHKNDLKDYSVEPLIFEYGNWKYTLIALGFSNKESVKTTFQDLINLQDELEGLPSLEEAKEASINTKLLINTYGNWRNVKNELKNQTTKKYKIKKTKQDEFEKKIKKDEIILKKITEKYKRIPTVKMAIESNVEINRILKKYDTWLNARKELNLYEIYESAIIKEIKKLKTTDQNLIEKEFNKTKQLYKPTLKPLIKKYNSWDIICNKFDLQELYHFSENENQEIEKSLKNIKLIEKIIGKFPEIEDVSGYDVNIELLLKKYGSWENIKD